MERYHTKKLWSGIKSFWTIQNSSPVISSINKLNNSKALKSMSKFTAFTGGTRDYVAVYSSGAFWSRTKSKAPKVNQGIPH